MGLGTNTDVQLLRLPQYQDVTKGLRESLRYGRQVDRQKKQDASQALKNYIPIAEQKTINDALTQTKSELDQESEQKVNLSFEQMALDKEYKTGMENLDASYKQMEANHIAGYDGSGNLIPLSESPEGLAYQRKQEEFDKKHAGYTAQLDQKLEGINAQAQTTLAAQYDPTNVKNKMQEALAQGGIGLEKADLASSLAAKPYQNAPMTEIQKIAAEAEIGQAQERTKAEYKANELLLKGTEKTTATGGKGSVLDSNGNLIVGKKGWAKSAGYSEYEDSKDRVMNEIDSLGWGIWKDNKDVKNKILDPLYQEFGHLMSASEITDEIMATKDDGFWKDTLKSGTTKESIRASLIHKLSMKAQASGAGNTKTTGRPGISLKEYNKLNEATAARGKLSLSRVLAQHQGKGNKSTSLANLQARIADYNATGTEKPTTTKTVEGGSTSKKLFPESKSIIGKAMNSGRNGDLARAVANEADGAKKFAKEFDALNPTQQKSVTAVLSNKQSQKVYDAVNYVNEKNGKYDSGKDTKSEIEKTVKPNGLSNFEKGLNTILGNKDKASLKDHLSISGNDVANAKSYKDQLKLTPTRLKQVNSRNLKRIIKTQKDRHPAGTRISRMAEKELKGRDGLDYNPRAKAKAKAVKAKEQAKFEEFLNSLSTKEEKDYAKYRQNNIRNKMSDKNTGIINK